MLFSYDPDKVPEISGAIIEQSRVMGMHIIHVICDEPGAKHGDAGGVTFITMTPFLPKPGDRIELSDGTSCEVSRVFFRVVETNDDDGKLITTALFPNVVAIKLGDQS